MAEFPSLLKGFTIIEFSHMVMGPSAGLVLADLGANVIKVEPIGGDKTRILRGSGAGYFSMYNRNKKSIAVDLKSPIGIEIVKKLIAQSDALIENFRAGAMDKLGLGADDLMRLNPRLIYCSHKGFLSGPYEQRTALDEVTQMMSGLAYMTGPPGQPLRAGASVIDVLGGTFGALGILAALLERAQTGTGKYIQSGLYEAAVFLVGQHMAQYAVTGQAAQPMPARISAWSVYDVFDTKDDEKVFIGVVSDGQWRLFCEKYQFTDWLNDAALASNNERVAKRDEILPPLRTHFAAMPMADIMADMETLGLPFAPIRKPEDLFTDPHLQASGGLIPLTLPEQEQDKDKNKGTILPALPLEVNHARAGKHHDVPLCGEHTEEIMRMLGYSDDEIAHYSQDKHIASTKR